MKISQSNKTGSKKNITPADRYRQCCSRDTRIAVLKQRVAGQWRVLRSDGVLWSLPIAGFAAGLLLPVTTDKASVNPIKQGASLVKKLLTRTVRIAVVGIVAKALRGDFPAASNGAEPTVTAD